MIYIDTSALVKKYAAERGSQTVRNLLRMQSRALTSKLTYAEACAAFSRKLREGGIEAQNYRKAWRSFASDWEAFVWVDLHEELFPLIRRLTTEYPLRGADAVHLASAVWVGAAIGQPLTFVVSDNALSRVARQEGLEVIDPEEN